MQWRDLQEGGLTTILGYVGDKGAYKGRVLRLRKGEGSTLQIQDDLTFLHSVIKPLLGNFVDVGAIVTLSRASVARLNTDPTIQGARAQHRLIAAVKDLDTTAGSGAASGRVMGVLMEDLTVCPKGESFSLQLATAHRLPDQEGLSVQLQPR